MTILGGKTISYSLKPFQDHESFTFDHVHFAHISVFWYVLTSPKQQCLLANL